MNETKREETSERDDFDNNELRIDFLINYYAVDGFIFIHSIIVLIFMIRENKFILISSFLFILFEHAEK
jgi:cytochrome c oxidase subunit IV